MAVLTDTGFLVALLDRDDPHHRAARAVLGRERGPFIVPSPVLPEVCYLANKFLGAAAELSFLESLAAGELTVAWSEPRDLGRIIEVARRRPDLGMVDAAVIATAERLKLVRLATLDRRHFSSFRPAHCAGFHILP
ncbi:MAG: PIN domain-containing protein [Elusimicrobia bacterium]|nr:PIN domain-containing protein [Elusimicrobiota bacterium]